MNSVSVAASNQRFGGEISEAAVWFLGQLRELLRDALVGRGDLEGILMHLLVDLQAMRKNGYDLDGALRSGWRPALSEALMSNTALEKMGSPRTIPSDAEREVLKDMDGLIDFAMRNGLSFESVISTLAHDVSQIRFHEWSLVDAKEDPTFHLRTAGWASRNLAIFGDDEGEKE